MANINPADFSKFLATMAQSAPMSASLDALQKRIEEQKAKEQEQQVMRYYTQIQAKVAELKRIRKQEKLIKGMIDKLTAQCQKYLEQGEADDEDETI